MIQRDFEYFTAPSNEDIKGTYQNHKSCGFILNIANNMRNKIFCSFYRDEEDYMEKF